MKQIPYYINTPIFLRFVEYYFNKFKAERTQTEYGRWLHEFEQMEQQGLFKPAFNRALYIKMLIDTFRLGFIRGTAIWYIGIYAQDATKAYFDDVDNFQYRICVMTGETAVDEDGDEYTELSYDEATQICQSLNDEAEEELFKIEKII